MKKTLKPFQRIGAEFLAKRKHALLADEMGLGKTVTALAAVEAVGAKRVLIVCPASVRTNWAQEISECGAFGSFDILSYNGAVKGLGGNWDALILDEAHFLKTPDSQRTQAIFGNEKGLARRAHFIWGLTGTPVLNRPRELYPILKTLYTKGIEPYTTWEKFTQRYCGAFFDGRGINTKGASNIEELRKRMDGFMLRRTKAQVLPELPPRIVAHPALELSKEEMAPIFEMESTIANREAYLSPTHEDFSQLGDMARLLKVTGVAKVKQVAAFVEDLLETEEKVVIFARHRDVIKGLDQALGHYLPVSYHGGMNDEQKKTMVSRFVGEKDCQVFIGQIQAAGTGINGLQKVCSNVVFAELSWVPGEMAQAVDRCHRIGQTSDAVNVYLPHVPGTLESAMLQVQLSKNRVIEALVGVREDDCEGLL
jgi:SWI/SNF-related matrix-associated actin-dependent regulator 1 of chromatin subfamily A